MNVPDFRAFLVSVVADRETSHKVVESMGSPRELVDFSASKAQAARTALAEFDRYLASADPSAQAVASEILQAEPVVSLRAYFMAHAGTPPAWFEPDMPPKPVEPDARAELDSHQREQLDGLGDWLDEPDADPAVLEFARRQAAADELRPAWMAEFAKQKSVQWPRAWADLMLAEHAKPERAAVPS